MQKIIFEVNHTDMETDFQSVLNDPIGAWAAAGRLQHRMRRSTIQSITVTKKVS